jgi:membrane protein DedA with SNARE-associated domain
MPLSQLLADYGYPVLFLGCLLEGETILIMAGFAAHSGHLSLSAVLGIAFVGGWIGDQIYFWVGRAWGPALLARYPRIGARALLVNRLLLRYHAALIVGIRFIYGLRIVGPIAIGGSGVAPWRFAFFNALGAAIWAPLVGGAGYLFGHTLEMLLGDIEHYEAIVLGVTVAGALAIAVAHRVWRSRRE